MKRNHFLQCTIYCLLLPIFLFGCGGGGPGSPGSSGSEDTGVNVNAQIVGLYDDEPTNSVDVFQGICDEEAEFFATHQATVTFNAQLLNPDTNFQIGNLTIDNYTIEYRRLDDSITAPPIEKFVGPQTIVIPAPVGSGIVTVTADIVLLDLVRKDTYATDMLSGRYNSSAYYINNYVAIFTFKGKNDYGEDFTIKAQMTFEIGNFDNCD